MNTAPEEDLAARVEAVVAATAGVTAIFRAGSAMGRAMDTAARALGVRGEAEPFVVIVPGEDGTNVDVAIGVSGSAGAVDTVRRVHDAIAAEIGHDGLSGVRISVTVVHIDDVVPAGAGSREPAAHLGGEDTHV